MILSGRALAIRQVLLMDRNSNQGGRENMYFVQLHFDKYHCDMGKARDFHPDSSDQQGKDMPMACLLFLLLGRNT